MSRRTPPQDNGGIQQQPNSRRLTPASDGSSSHRSYTPRVPPNDRTPSPADDRQPLLHPLSDQVRGLDRLINQPQSYADAPVNTQGPLAPASRGPTPVAGAQQQQYARNIQISEPAVPPMPTFGFHSRGSSYDSNQFQSSSSANQNRMNSLRSDEESLLPQWRQASEDGNYMGMYNSHYGGPNIPQQHKFPRRGYLNKTPAPSVHSSSDESAREWKLRVNPIKRGVTKHVKLVKDHIHHDFPVSETIVSTAEKKWFPLQADGKASPEVSKLTYTGAFCDPDQFTVENGYKLRQVKYGRQTELLIAITYYNEDRLLLSRTLHSVMLNIRDICTSKSKFWNRGSVPAWQKIVVMLVFDGFNPADPEVLDLLASIGVFQWVLLKRLNGKSPDAHIFEYTTQLSVKPGNDGPVLISPHESNDGVNMVPVQMIFCLKNQNSKKINSHRWVFNAIGKQLNPEVCILLDAGTKPATKSLYYLWQAFYNNKNLGGACGEIYAQTKNWKLLLNPLVAAQNFEYKMSNILDKPLESSFGYVSVLPGAFSAYRFGAIQGRPLTQYFHGDMTLAAKLGKKGLAGMSIFTKNMFLAEDRILCFELVAKQGCKWTLAYVQEARGETDIPEQAAELISQRRRWLNGSFAASVYSLAHFHRIYQSSHGLFRLFFLHIQAIYNVVTLLFSWLLIGNLWLTFSIIIILVPRASGVYFFGTETITYWVNLSARWLYAATIALQFILALGNRPKGERVAYNISFIIFGLLGIYLFVCAIFLTVRSFTEIKIDSGHGAWEAILSLLDGPSGVLIASLCSTFIVYLVSSVLFGDPWHMINSFLQYLCIMPSFTNICNLHDVSWGTKGSDKAEVLPDVVSKKKQEKSGANGEEWDVELLELDQEIIESELKSAAQRAFVAYKVEETKEAPSMDDSNKSFRTWWIATWLFSNGLVIGVVTNIVGNSNDDGLKEKRQSIYFNVVLWSTFGLIMVKFIGSVYFWVQNTLFRCCMKT